MLWTALNLTRLPLDCIPQAPERAFVVVEKRRVAAASAAAQAAGVRQGHSLAAALALAPSLTWTERVPEREAAALEALCLWALQFSAGVVPAPPRGLLIETGGSARLFGGRDTLLRCIVDGLEAQGFAATLSSAPTPGGARMLAAAGFAIHLDTLAALRAALPGLPVGALPAAAGCASTLESLGVRTVADLLALPRDGLARRFGPHLLDELDRAFGHAPDPVQPLVPPPAFRTTLALPAPAESADALVFACRRAFDQLEGFLRSTRRAVDRIDLTLHHERSGRGTPGDAAQALTLNFFEPTAAAGRFLLILRERLDRTALVRRVERITVSADALTEAREDTRPLLPEPERAHAGLGMLLERLSARLGPASLSGVGLHADHRPAHASTLPPLDMRAAARKPARPGGGHPAAWGPRPTWLVEPPRPLAELDGKPHHEGPLTLMAGPERIESGWWDGATVTRDYFIARTPSHALVWVFRERGLPEGWFLQGIFG